MQPKRILVALAGTSADPDMLRLVASIAKVAKSEVVGIHVIEVRWNLPLDAVMEPELDRGEELLASAKKLADLAGLLDSEGHRVSVVDIASTSPARAERAWFQHLPSSFKGETILGDGTDLEVLRQAGIERADAFLALTEGDNRNLMAAQIAQKIFGLKQVIAKVNDPVRAQTYREMGIHTFSRTTILGTLLHAMPQGDREVGEVLVRKALAHEADMVHEPVKAH